NGALDLTQSNQQIKTLKLFSPHQGQKQLISLAERNRFVVAVWGRQAGKSTGAINLLSKTLWEARDGPGVYWYLTPTHNQAKIMYRRMKSMFSEAIALKM